jgi:predicted nucleotidyltransferase
MQDMIDRFVTWAQRRPDVRAGIVLGSWARNDMPADNLSDLDLVVIVSDPSVFLSRTVMETRRGPGQFRRCLPATQT